MNRITDIKTIYEYTNKDLDMPCGLYQIMFRGRREILIRNGESFGVIAHFYSRAASECVSPICDDVRDEFIELLKNQNNDSSLGV